MSEERHPQDKPDPQDPPPVDQPPTKGGFPVIPWDPPSSSHPWEDNAELHGDETGGQEP